VVVSGLIIDIRTRQTKKGTRMATIILDDRTARMEVVVYSETLETHREMLQVDRVVAILGNLSFDDFAGSNRVVADQILTVEQARSRFASNLLIEWPTPMTNGKLPNQNEALQDLLCALKPYAGGECAVHIRFQDEKASAELVLGEAWHVQPSDDLLKKLQVVAGGQNQLMRYAPEPNI
jgi:DNA polymerase-3 subunit alpha